MLHHLESRVRIDVDADEKLCFCYMHQLGLDTDRELCGFCIAAKSIFSRIVKGYCLTCTARQEVEQALLSIPKIVLYYAAVKI